MKSEAEKRAVEKLKSPQPDFGAFRAAAVAEGKKWEEEEVRRAVASGDIGRVMPDGTVYAGLSPDTQQPMFAAAVKSPKMGFNEAAAYAGDLVVGGRKDFRVPTKDELNVLFVNREKGALKDIFNIGSYCWSSTSVREDEGLCQDFRDGQQWGGSKIDKQFVICIRPEPKP